mmetsp:Transcript_27275/g.70730  ORF Transcript_27275/g.70730 Transcript_27275/m.70730 type:complete len:291 (-) Transcript_27275:695-1567(-)
MAEWTLFKSNFTVSRPVCQTIQNSSKSILSSESLSASAIIFSSSRAVICTPMCRSPLCSSSKEMYPSPLVSNWRKVSRILFSSWSNCFCISPHPSSTGSGTSSSTAGSSEDAEGIMANRSFMLSTRRVLGGDPDAFRGVGVMSKSMVFVLPNCSRRVTWSACSSRLEMYSTTSTYPCFSAISDGEFPATSRRLRSAFALYSRWTISQCPHMAATCIALAPILSVALISAFWSSRNCTVVTWQDMTARSSAVVPSGPRASGLALQRSMTWISSRNPCSAATTSGGHRLWCR